MVRQEFVLLSDCNMFSLLLKKSHPKRAQVLKINELSLFFRVVGLFQSACRVMPSGNFGASDVTIFGIIFAQPHHRTLALLMRAPLLAAVLLVSY